MRITGNYFWMRNVTQRANGVYTDSLPRGVQNVIAEQNEDAISNEMKLKIQKSALETKISRGGGLLDAVIDELVAHESKFLGALQFERTRLGNLVSQEDEYTAILNGTANYDASISKALSFSKDSEMRLGIVDFTSYLKALPPSKTDDIETTGISVIRDVNGEEMLLSAGQAPVYEQWYAEQVDKLKTFAGSRLPQVQNQIETTPQRVASLYLSYQIGKIDILRKVLTDDELKSHIDGLSENDFVQEMKALDSGDGESMLKLLEQMVQYQRGIVEDIGGNAFFGVEQIEKGHLDKRI